PFWSRKTLLAYEEYMGAAFDTYQGSGEDAKIRTLAFEKISGIDSWTERDTSSLTGERDREHRALYDALLEAFAEEFAYVPD
ncbi:MAG: hypothetical protein AAGD40_07520, partial [Pseudomonadota bacterium]